MWESCVEPVGVHGSSRYKISQNGERLSYSAVLDLWLTSAPFCNFCSGVLAESTLTAYRWETPPVTAENIGREFEFVLLRCDSLERRVDPASFAEHFDNDRDVVTFPNIGRNAILVVPCPSSSDPAAESIYCHLASFIRGASQSQVRHLWQSTADAMKKRIGDKPVWLSTAGMGVAWLHILLDDRPKYYGHAPYKQFE